MFCPTCCFLRQCLGILLKVSPVCPMAFLSQLSWGISKRLNTGSKCVYSKKGLLTTLGCDAKGQPVYVLEGAVFIAGAVIQWLRDELTMIKDSSSTEKMINGVKDTNGVYFVPAFVGLG